MNRVVRSLQEHKLGYTMAALFVAFVAMVSAAVFRNDSHTPLRIVHASTNYTYEEATSREQVRLHLLVTMPEYVSPLTIKNNVLAAGIYGINGGFFWNGSLLSLAIEDDKPVNGEPYQYGSGWSNAKYARGTLVYDKSSNMLSVQTVIGAEQILVLDRTRYWAQGGISMSLQDGLNWKSVATDQVIPFPEDLRLRSGMVYDRSGQIYLIVSSTKCTAEQFRSGILEQDKGRGFVDGIFLDGDGSSQLLSKESQLAGDGRMVVQMLMLK
jgi:hypothetical protein